MLCENFLGQLKQQNINEELGEQVKTYIYFDIFWTLYVANENWKKQHAFNVFNHVSSLMIAGCEKFVLPEQIDSVGQEASG